MTKQEMVQTVDEIILAHFQDPFVGSVADWCCYINPDTGEPNLRFDEPGNRGPFTTTGREYIIEPLNDWGDKTLSDCVEVFGSQSGKTGMLMAGAAWSVCNDPCGILWVMPSGNLAQSFSETRWQPMLRASAATRDLIPTGVLRHDFKKLQQQLGASVINFVGSNSPANLASRPARKVILDEVDKFNEGGKGEADAVNLAEQRTKGQAYPQRRKTSTPSLFDGLIWQEFLKGDQRRYHVPCPHCSKRIVFGWSERFYTLSKTGCESYVVWDKEAQIAPGKWDLERVEKSAHIECCHCGGHILDGHKPGMIAKGEWIAGAKAEPGFRSRHLSSIYACSPETTFGKLAKKFLQSKLSLLGLQGFINGDLAEPYTAQDSSLIRLSTVERPIITEVSGVKIASFDYQQNSPRFWYVVREWRESESVAIDAGPLETWNDVEKKVEQHKVDARHVVVDSRYQEQKEFPEVAQECSRHIDEALTIEINKANQGLPIIACWLPSMGHDRKQRWKDTETGLEQPFGTDFKDPFIGTSDQGQFQIVRFHFAADWFKDRLWEMRQGMTAYKWTVLRDVANDEYQKHLSAEYKDLVRNRRTGRIESNWKCRSHWPNHLFDCENQNLALACHYGYVRLMPEQEKGNND